MLCRKIRIRCASVAVIHVGLALNDLRAQTPDASQGQDGAIRRALDAQDWTSAERELRKTLLQQPDNVEAHRSLGYILFREARPAESLAEYTKTAASQTPSLEDMITVCSDYILMKDYADAEHWLLYTTQHFPNDAHAWYLLGRTQYKLDRVADAAASYRRSLQLSRGDLRSEYNLGLALEKLGKPAEAEATYRAAITLQQQTGVPDPQPYLDLGMLMTSQQRYAEALVQLQQAAVLGPANAMVQQQLGLVLEALGRNDEAAVALQRAVSIAPEAGQPHLLLGRIYRKLGRTKDAASQFAEVQRLYGTQSDKETPNDPPLADVRHPAPNPQSPAPKR